MDTGRVLEVLAALAYLIGFVATVVAVGWLVVQWWRGYGPPGGPRERS